jgi:hypothetical protein
VKIHALLIWYDEQPRQLASCVAGIARLADHLVAVDGAFYRYPQGRPHSGGSQATTIYETAVAAGMAVTLHSPATVWHGDEPAKRNHSLDLARAQATEMEDWLLVLDSDETVTWVSELARKDLEETDSHAADVQFHVTESNPHDWQGRTRRLYRLLPGLRYTTTHFTMAGYDPDLGEQVFVNGRGGEYGEPFQDALDLTAQVHVEHRHGLRTPERDRAAAEFMQLRHFTEPWPIAEQHRDGTDAVAVHTPPD